MLFKDLAGLLTQYKGAVHNKPLGFILEALLQVGPHLIRQLTPADGPFNIGIGIIGLRFVIGQFQLDRLQFGSPSVVNQAAVDAQLKILEDGFQVVKSIDPILCQRPPKSFKSQVGEVGRAFTAEREGAVPFDPANDEWLIAAIESVPCYLVLLLDRTLEKGEAKAGIVFVPLEESRRFFITAACQVIAGKLVDF